MIIWEISVFGPVQKSPSSPVLRPLEGKATVIFASGAYTKHVSTEKWRERRWRLFSTGPDRAAMVVGMGRYLNRLNRLRKLLVVFS